MTQELKDFENFRDNRLHFFCPTTGRIDSVTCRGRVYEDVGSINEDGYVRIRMGQNTMRMKHRFVHFLVTGKLPVEGEEIDHKNDIRSDNRPSNLRIVTKPANNTGCANRAFGKQMTPEKVHSICKLLAETNLSDKTIAEQTGITRATVRDIKVRRSRTSISAGYEWKHREK
ncbi:MAG: HNH endonuclease [Paracoccus denitrificans]|uniref:HNH endonuclease n=1 Tax=Paracoccus denitrificans TaxID=266 RepID=A0A533I0G3_PARDE|nr:MAG: HNH endonuclease [Paracoccus denitrificans]